VTASEPTFRIEESAPESVDGDTHPLLAALYQGRVFKLPPTMESLQLVAGAHAILEHELGSEMRAAHARIGEDAHFQAIGRARRIFYLERAFQRHAMRITQSLGLDIARIAFDPIRIRVIQSGGHANPRAQAVYYPHRDVWYGHPASLITVWIPLDDLPEDETFVFHPAKWSEPVPNDSEIFDYDEWVSKGWGLKIGWQNKNDGLEARYPGVTEAMDPGPAVGFSCARGETLLFSGQHFHRTLPQTKGRTRLSLDFRIVQIDDVEAGHGAPNVDNRSRGSALVDYARGIDLVEDLDD